MVKLLITLTAGSPISEPPVLGALQTGPETFTVPSSASQISSLRGCWGRHGDKQRRGKGDCAHGGLELALWEQEPAQEAGLKTPVDSWVCVWSDKLSQGDPAWMLRWKRILYRTVSLVLPHQPLSLCTKLCCRRWIYQTCLPVRQVENTPLFFFFCSKLNKIFSWSMSH